MSWAFSSPGSFLFSPKQSQSPAGLALLLLPAWGDNMELSALISGGASLLSGLFGSSSAKKARARALEDEKQKFVRLREAAELGGFNPLTALENSGQTFGSNLPSGAPPLASIDMITNGIKELGNEFTGVNAQQRAREQLEYDLAKLKLDQARHSAARAVAPGLPQMGRQTHPGASSNAPLTVKPGGGSLIDPTRKLQTEPVKSFAGWYEEKNAGSGGTIYLPGNDGETEDILQLVTRVAIGGPQVAKNYAQKYGFFTPDIAKATQAGDNDRWFPVVGSNPYLGVKLQDYTWDNIKKRWNSNRYVKGSK